MEFITDVLRNSNQSTLVFGGQLLGEVKNQALLIENGFIVRVAPLNEIKRELKYQGVDPCLIDLKGATIMPGFIESHGHFLGIGRLKQICDLTGAKSIQEIHSRLNSFAKNNNLQSGHDWIIGRGYDEHLFQQLRELAR